MARKPAHIFNQINPATGLPWRLRAPREMRVVSSSMQQSGEGVAKRSVAQIRLSGAWLERIGFVRGAQFLVLIDGPGQIVLTAYQND